MRSDHVKNVAKCEGRAVVIGLAVGFFVLLLVPYVAKVVCQ